MERLEAGVVTREFQTVISVFSLRRIEDEERGYRKGGGRARGSSPCRVTRVQRVTNVSDSKLVRSGSFSLAFVVPCKSLVSRNTWNSCVGLRTLSRKPCNHLLLFILQLSPPSIEFLFFPPWKLIFTECVSFIFLYLEKEKLDGYQRCYFFFCWLKMWYNTQYNRFKNSSSSFELDIILYKIIGEELHLFTMDPGWFRDVSQPIFISSKHYDLRNAKLDSCKSSNAHVNIQMPRNFMQFRIDRTWCNLLFLFLFTSSVTNPNEYPSPLTYLILLIRVKFTSRISNDQSSRNGLRNAYTSLKEVPFRKRKRDILNGGQISFNPRKSMETRSGKQHR